MIQNPDERCGKCAMRETGDCLMLDGKMHSCPVWFRLERNKLGL